MSSETAKKRKRDGKADDAGVGGGGDVDVVARIMAEMKAQMERMQNELDDTKGRLCHIEEVDRQSASMKNEMEETKSRLSHVDELERRCQSLESSLSDTRVECQFLKARCESLERSVQILSKDTKWEYAAPSIPNSHWIARGFDENYIEGMEVFLKRIKKYTCALRRGACGEDIGLGVLFGDGDDTVLPHDDALVPHWREFANALQLYKNPDDSHGFGIFNMQLTSSVMDLLTPALKEKPMDVFGMNRNEFANAREGINFAIEIIQSNRKLEEFGWANNPIENMADANHLVRIVISHPTIDKITLENCFGGSVDAYGVLRSLLASNKEICRIDIVSNNMQTGGGTEISDFLATNPPLQGLSLANNRLDDNDASLIARALKRNTNLQHLQLDRNNITNIGYDALRNAIYDSTSLNAVSASNHSCSIEGLDLDIISNNRYGDTSELNRGRKIYSALSSRNREGTNVQHLDAEFGDESLTIVPKVLECVHSYAEYGSRDDVHPLSLMYEIFRSWKMPTLYENNGAR